MKRKTGARNFFLAEGLEGFCFEDILNIEGRVVRVQKNRRTVRFEKDGNGYFVKIHRGAGWKEIFKNILQFKLPILGAQSEMRAIVRLGELGVPTMELAGYGVRGLCPAWLESFVITKEIENSMSLEELAGSWISNPPPVALKRVLIEKLAHISRTLHRGGVNHRDYYLCHFLVDREGIEKKDYNHLDIRLIDLHRVQIRKRTPVRWIIKDIAGLYFSAMEAGLSTRDHLRFMKAYSLKPLRDILKEEKSFWAVVENRAERLHKKHWRGTARSCPTRDL